MASLRPFAVIILMYTANVLTSSLSEDVILPNKTKVFENNNTTILCEYKGNKSLEGLQFIIDKTIVISLFFPSCKDVSKEQEKYNCNIICENNTKFTLEWTNVTRADHDKRITCKFILTNNEQDRLEQSGFVYVIVPVKNVTLGTSDEGGYITTCMNETQSISCNTTASRPKPEVHWIFKDNNSMEHRFEEDRINTESNIKDGLFISSSTLQFVANKSLNNGSIYCFSRNIQEQDPVKSDLKKIKIEYPPQQPPFISNVKLKNGSVYSIITGKKGKLICDITLSNPKARLHWECSNKYTLMRLDDTILEWNASRNDTDTCKCVAHHTCYNWTKSLIVKRLVLYPPTVSNMTSLKIVEGEELTVTCTATKGEPADMSFAWTRGKDNFRQDKQRLSVQNISKSDASLYNCTVNNTMIPTKGDPVEGRQSGFISIDVLYPPRINDIEDQVTTEGDVFNLSCPVIPGNPNQTKFKWTLHNGTEISNVQELQILNVSKHHDLVYTCTVNNIMEPTDTSEDVVLGTYNESFRLNVEYSATIYSFYVVGQQSQSSNVTVNESEEVTFICNVESNPVSHTDIRLKRGHKLVANQSNRLTHTLTSAECFDTAEYICNGQNKHNKHNSTRPISLFIRCAPKQNPFIHFEENITTAKNNSVVLALSVLAYPAPTNEIWQIKKQGQNWTNITNSTNTLIQRFDDLNYSLTINNVWEDDFGQYRLVISNDVGKLEKLFHINPEDKPDPPSGFHVVPDKITDTEITVQWFPSFDGGKQQHFILNFSSSDTQIWESTKIKHFKETLVNFTIDGLSSNTLYLLQLYAENIIGRSRLSKILNVRTKYSKNLSDETGYSVHGIVIGCTIGVAVVIVIIFFAFRFFKRRRKGNPDKQIYQNVPKIGYSKKSKKAKQSPVILDTNIDEKCLQEVDDAPQLQFERTEYYNSAEKIELIDRINLTELLQYVLGKDEDEFAIEYQSIPTELQMPCIFARKAENIALNRFKGIFPYDHSRVKIPTQPDFFINACYIDGFQRRNAYIASLGPTERTTNKFVSFWQMVWEKKSDIIVMLTNLREISGMKCEQYWPDDGSIMYGEIAVSCLKTDIFAEYTVRIFRLSKDQEQHAVTHLHYTAWPDKTVPEDVTSLLEFRQRMIATPTNSKSPCIVHCSAGIGRTGTLIAIDRLVAEGIERESVNVLECVKSMRKQRVKMVQTLEQYIFVYKALAYALSFECEAMTIKDFSKHVDATHSSKYSRQFQQLKQTVEKDNKEEQDARNRNEKQTNKNRLGADIPGDRFRVFLHLDKEDDSNYINAVYINSFKTKDKFIIGQTPLQSTVKDFISMAYQENCICIVAMDDLNESEKTVGKYISDSKRKNFGNFNISSSILETKHQYILREMKIKYEGKYQRGEKSVYHFQYTKWLQENQTPEKAEDFVMFVKEVHQYATELGHETSQILVHCLNAYERSGLFCAVSVIIEKLQLEDRVSVTNTVRHLRTRRRSVINSKEQLLFCYQAAGAFVRLHDI